MTAARGLGPVWQTPTNPPAKRALERRWARADLRGSPIAVALGLGLIRRPELRRTETSRIWRLDFSSEVVPSRDVHGAHCARCRYPPKRRRPQRGRKARKAWRVREILDLPSNIQMMAFLRSKAKRFTQRCIPIKFAGPFDRAASLVPVGRGRRRRKRRGIKKRERRSSANAEIRISNLIGTQRKARAGPIVRCQSTQICRNWSSGLPGNDILQPPITEDVARHATVSVAMMLAERKFVERSDSHLMAYVERRESALRREVEVLLHHNRRGSTDGAGIVQRFGEGVKGLERNAMSKTMDQADLQAVVNGIGSGLIEIKTVGVRNLQLVLGVQRAGTQRGAIGRAQQIQVSSLGAGVG